MKEYKVTELFIRDIPVHLKSLFKSYCAARNISMKQALIGFMKECVAKDQEVPPRFKVRKARKK